MRGRSIVALTLLVAAFAVSCAKDPETAKREYLAQGDRLLGEKKYAEAAIQYRNAIRQDPRFGEARLKLGEAFVAGGDMRNALAETVRAADLMPDSVEAQLRAGQLLFLSGQFPEAKARALAALAKEPKNPRALIMLGDSLAGLKDMDGAIEQVEQAIDEAPQLTLGYSNLAQLYIAKGDRDAAESAFRRAVEVAPKSASAHVSLANFLWAAGNRDEAERELKAAIEIEPKSVTANRALAALYIAKDWPTGAEGYLKTYAEVNPTVPSRLLLADHYVRLGKTTEATTLLSDIAKQEAGLVPATLRLAALDFDNQRRPGAYQRLEDILAKQPKNEPTLQMKAQFFLAEGKSRDALNVATTLVDIDPKSPKSQFVRGVALEGIGSLDEAVSAFQAVLQGAPSAAPAQFRLARLYLHQNNVKGALDLSQQLVKARPQGADGHLVYAQALLRSGELANAERELLALSKTTPSSPDVHTWLGMLYEAKHDAPRARQSYQKALDLQPRADVALAGLISTDLSDKKPAVAIARVESQLAKSPNDVRLLSLAGMAYSATNNLSKAEATYRKIIQIAPNNIDAYGRLGAIYVAQKRLDDGRKTFQEMAKRQTKPVAAETMLGMIMIRQNNMAEARKHFERALVIDPRAAVAANNLAWDYANNGGNLDAALQLAQTAKTQLPDNAQISDTLGWVYYKKGLTSNAVDVLREAAKQSPSSANIHYHLGLAYLQNGNKAEAKASLQQVLKLAPQFQDAAEVRRVLATIDS